VLELVELDVAPLDGVSLADVLVLVSTEQPARPRARSAASPMRWFFFMDDGM
jgi:hypothetical protein